MCGLGGGGGSSEKKNQMGEAGEGRMSSSSSSMTQNLLDKYPRDLLQRFMSSNHHQSGRSATDEEAHELELNLGLSLGGRFGVDKSPKNKLIRSSSIAGFVPIPVTQQGEDSSPGMPRASYVPLMRTTSLPTETEEEWRKRKELQTLRRMAAKKRRSEKQRSLNSKADKEGGEEAGASGRACNSGTPPLGLPSWAQAVLGSGDSGGGPPKGKSGVLGASGGSGVLGFGSQASIGSAESQGGGSSSGMSESDSKSKQGSGSGSGARSPVSYQLVQDRISNDPAGSSGTKTRESSAPAPRPGMESPSKKPEPVENRGKEIGISAVEDMPCVFTKGDGPNGRRIEGILYKYGKGEELRIMCVCHGSFLSPAEFVKHAGGGDVAHPLRHIVINPNPTFTR